MEQVLAKKHKAKYSQRYWYPLSVLKMHRPAFQGPKAEGGHWCQGRFGGRTFTEEMVTKGLTFTLIAGP